MIIKTKIALQLILVLFVFNTFTQTNQ